MLLQLAQWQLALPQVLHSCPRYGAAPAAALISVTGVLSAILRLVSKLTKGKETWFLRTVLQ